MSTEAQYGDLSIVIVAYAHNPTILNPDWLARRRIIDEAWGWELSQPPVCTPAFSTVAYNSGVSIQVQPPKAIFTETRPGALPDNTRMPQIVAAYVRQLPEVEYKAVGINPNLHVLMSSAEEASSYVVQRFAAQGPWAEYAGGPIDARVALRFGTDDTQTNVTIQPVQYGPTQEERRPVVLFAGNIHRDIKGADIDVRHAQLLRIMDGWKEDCFRFKDLVDHILLGGS